MNRPTIVRDAAGNMLTWRNTDGTGWNRTYDDNGSELSFTEIKPKEKTMNNDYTQKRLDEIYGLSEFIKQIAEKSQDYTNTKTLMALMIQPMKDGLALLSTQISQLDTHVNELDQ